METNNVSTTIKDRLQMILEMSGLSIAAFERKLGWSNGSFAKLTDNLSFGRVKTIVDAFGVDRNWLLSGKGEMFKVHDVNLFTKQNVPDDVASSPTPETKPKNADVVAALPPYDFTYHVTAESLKPSVEVGDTLFLKEIEPKGVVSGNPYVIMSTRYGTLLSIVNKVDGEIVCASINNLLVAATDVSAIYKIVGQLKLAVNLNCADKAVYDELKQHSDRMTSIVEKNSEIMKSLTDSNANMQNQIDVLLGMLNKKI